MNNRYILIFSLMLTALLAGGNAAAQVVVSGSVFGGGNEGEVHTNSEVSIEAGTVQTDVYGGGNKADVTGNVSVTMTGGTVNRDVYGGGALANTNIGNATNYGDEANETISSTTTNTTTVNLTGGTVKGDVYGGGLGRPESGDQGTPAIEAKVYGDVLVTLNGTKMVSHETGGVLDAGRVFGANNINGTPKGHVKVLVQKTASVEDQVIDAAAVFGGGNQAAYEPVNANDYAEVEIHETTDDGHRLIVGNVYGGGNEAGIGNTTTVAGTQVDIVAGDVRTGIYGGCNSSGTVTGNIAVNIIGGTLGTSSTSMTSGIFGGGYGSATATSGNITVTVGDAGGTSTPTIYADVYGGSALGSVNDAAADLTRIDFLNGTLHGNLYGGGLGEANVVGEGGSITTDNSAKGQVNGRVVVNIGSSAQDPAACKIDLREVSIYGCNNTNGSPKDDVTVNIYKTAHNFSDYPDDTGNDKYKASYTEAVNNVAPAYAIYQVFGGGNQAAYNPVAVALPGTPHSATVNVYTCLNTIETIYGGGNAADATDVRLIIEGGRFDQVFGGGNGFSSTGNHSNPSAPNYNPGANITGSATTEVHGGYYRQVFAGSNQYGDVASASLTLDTESDCGELVIEESFGGANEAEITGNVETTLACNEGTFSIGAFYGGSNKADIRGNVTLNVYGGTYTNVFGGSKGVRGGAAANIIDNPATTDIIEGNVTLNLYGGSMVNAFGGSDANGNISGKITVNVLNNGGTCGLLVNNIYGGGRDAAYTPTTSGAYPEVNLIHGTISKKGDGTGGNVFGGGYGSTATVTSNPQVNIGYDATSMGDLATANTLLYQLTQDATNYTSTTQPADFLASVTGTVYGGGDLAQVAGSTTVTLQKANSLVAESLFGGGNMASVSGNTTVNINDGTVTQDVYGGGALANVGTNANNTTQVTVSGGTMRNIYGGGLGQIGVDDDESTPDVDESVEAIAALVNGAVTVTVNGGTITDVFGCNNFNGAPQSSVQVNINNNVIGNVYGGGNQAAYTAPTVTNESPTAHDYPQVNILAGTVGVNAFGGGYGATATVTGNPVVNLQGGTVSGKVFGGGSAAPVIGNPTVNALYGSSPIVHGGGLGATATVTGNPTVVVNQTSGQTLTLTSAFGGGDAAPVTGNTTVTLTAGSLTNAFGGGNVANITGTTSVTLQGATVANIYGGGNQASVSSTSTVTLTSGTATSGVYGGCNTSGSVGDVTITLTGGTVRASGSGNKADVYGGGFGAATTTTGDIDITLNGTTVYGDLYGGSALGSVNHVPADSSDPLDVTTLTISSNTLYGSIYGGGKGDVAGEEGHSDVTATSNGSVIIYYNTANNNLTGLYGGANINGLVSGNIAVNVNADVGASGTGNSLDIFGGGYGANTNTGGNVTVTVGDAAGTVLPVIYGDIYGGSALGNVNDAAADLTRIDFLNGTLHGNIYGGGLGDKSSLGAGHSDVAALVNGKVMVNISSSDQTATNCHIDLRESTIYGCNNTNGSPQADVEVHIYKTAYNYSDYSSGNNYTAANGADPYYAIDQVFGGGNQADYAPEDGDASSTKKAKVYIHGCDNTIRRVFGGGNAAAAVGVQTNIDGGRFGYVFGGGNGEVTAANIGDGGTDLRVHGGKINDLFGGSNKNGSISGAMRVNVDNTGGCSEDMYVNEFFCGSNEANITTTQIETTIGCGTHFGDVYGGCNLADITGNIILHIVGGEMNNVYGGSKGRLADNSDPSNPIVAKAANIDGNVTLNIKGGHVGNAFGGSNINGNITGSIQVNVEKDATSDCGVSNWYLGNVYGASNEATYTPTNTGNTLTVNIKNGEVSGNVYGGGKGSTAIVTSNPAVTVGDLTDGHAAYVATVLGDVYGGGDAAGVTGNTSVTIQKANTTVRNAYGGGNEAAITGATTLTMAGGSTSNLYGGGNAAGVSSTATVTMDGGTVSTGIYGGCNANGTVSGAIAVNVNGGTVGTDATTTANVHGGGYGASTTTGASVTVTIGNGTSEPVIWGDVYGGSALGNVNSVAADVTKVWLKSGTVNGCLYGGGLGDVGHAALVNGTVQVDIDGGTVATTTNTARTTGSVFGCNNINGAPQQAVNVNVDGGTIANVYGGGNQAAYTGNPVVSVTGGTVGNVFGSGLGLTADVTGNTSVTISGGTVNNDVYGGGSLADVTGNVSVTISGGSVTGDVYGGGALANTNTDNWNPNSGSRDYYLQVYGLSVGTSLAGLNYYSKSPDIYTLVGTGGTAASGITYYQKADNYSPVPSGLIVVGSTDVSDYYIKDGDNYVKATGTAQDGVTYYQEMNSYTPVTGITTGADVSAYYTKTLGTYSLIESGNVEANAKYYEKKTLTGTWADGKNNPSTGTTYKTTVTLIGGKVGNVYGGGLGELAGINGATSTIEAFVYGDVTVTVGDGTDDSVGATAFTRVRDNAASTATGSPVYKTGHLFGANNINGTPTGNITVNVYKTAREDGGAHQSGKANSANFEIQGVYGGGNLADYLPLTGKQSKVYIDGCSDVSIEFVYGGGNSASVPGTKVDIQGALEIGYAFGGGNGNDKILKPNSTTEWYFKGADVNGDTYIDLHGGTIHWAFGGSNRLGDCTGDVYYQILSDNASCPLKITTLYGAGQNADVDGSLNLVIKCPSSGSGSYVENVYGGSLNAKISGGVTMTIIGGIYQNVHGGNDQSGSIGGPIAINIQETSDCQPVIIENLYGGGNKATYPADGVSGGNIQINVKSCTRIGTIYTGGHEADVNGNTELNINMVKGFWAGRDEYVGIPKTYEDIPNIEHVTSIDANTVSCKIKDEIGTIGDVFGGGDRGVVNGNAAVNIGTLSTVSINHYKANNDFDHASEELVLGAHITGNVYGGGNRADVTGDTYVRICAKETATPDVYESVTPGASGVTIDGTDYPYGVFGGGNEGDVQGNCSVYLGAGNVNQSIYGGGCKADVKGNTYVTMLDGYVYDGIYGGGLLGSVGDFNRSTAEEDVAIYGHTAHSNCAGKPTSLKTANTGKCIVVVSGGQVGPNAAADKDAMNDGIDVGFVFGAGRGNVEDPAVEPDTHFKTYVGSTDVTINGGLIMASVYGGGENGRVLGNTHVTISGGQIGCGVESVDGSGKPVPYDESLFFDPTKKTAAYINLNSLKECSSWDYESPYKSYDPFADKSYYESEHYGAASTTPTDGKTYYGCVFGGGSGYFPYEREDGTGHDWLWSAGVVEGNTLVDITGGHILTNIYGGNEYTDVLGSCTVNFGDPDGIKTPTLGVPRTLEQIAAHPVTCYLFGAGKGDQRSYFNTRTNVNSVVVNVTGGIIYGSVFGGGEEGHVKGDVTMTIGNSNGTGPIIGTWGTSYVEGNVFGGGRGFSGESLTAGNVGGSIDLKIKGGTMLGSVYGGGRLASVGYELANPKLADGTTDNPAYGRMLDGDNHGHITIDISGGTIGNGYEYDYIAPSVTGAALTTAKSNMPNTVHDSKNRLIHTKGGNVFAGGMGRRTALNGSVISNWEKLGCAKSTKLVIRNTSSSIKPIIKSNIYGGGEFGAVVGDHNRLDGEGNPMKDNEGNDIVTGTEIHITGGIIGTQIPEDGDNPAYYFGSVFGGGMGDETYGGGIVNNDTYVSIGGGTVRKDVYGGGEFGAVGENVVVGMSGGTVGNNLYGGGAYADTNTSNWDASANSNAGGWASGKTSASSTTYVHLTGGIIGYDVYGGGLGQWGDDTKAPKVYGDIHVDLNGAEPSPGLSSPISSSLKGCIVERVFGCNDQNGTPKGHVKVHVHATQNKNKTKISDKIGPDRYTQGDSEGDIHYLNFLIGKTTGLAGIDTDVVDAATALISGKDPDSDADETALTDAQRTAIKAAAKAVIKELEKTHDYDVQAVYGGGDLATYDPADAYSTNTTQKNAARTEVIIDGCDYTSIKQVYGGSNAAPAPASRVRVNSVYVIDELFGGGNGLDDYVINGEYYENPGANVGYKNYTYYDTGGTQGAGTLASPYKALDNPDATTKEMRQTNYWYGSGVANTEVAGGRIHNAYGGSNHKGNIAITSLSEYESMDDSCPLQVDESYGAGKDAPQDGQIDMSMDCVRNMEEIFGGAKNADVHADVKLTITNGSHFKRVFGGNNTSGAIAGTITVEIKESGCEPIIIEELYAGGYLAPYSIYGYEKGGDGNYIKPSPSVYEQERIPLTKSSFETYQGVLRSAMSADLAALGVAEDADQATIDAAIEAAIIGNDATKRGKALEYRACQDDLTSYPKKDPLVNVISATRIDNIYGGGYRALLVGSPHINVNMTDGRMLVANKGTDESPVYKDVNNVTHDASDVTSETDGENTRYYVPLPLGTIGTIFGGGNEADIMGDTYVEIGTGKWINREGKWETEDASGNTYTYEERTTGIWKWYKVGDDSDEGTTTDPTPVRNSAQIKYVENRGGGFVYGGGNNGDVIGNTNVTMANGSVENRIYGGGNLGHVGVFSTVDAAYNTANSTSLTIGKPYACTAGGVSNVVISGGVVGPSTTVLMDPSAPSWDKGHVFGAGRGADPSDDVSNNIKAFVNNANVTISGTAFVKGSVFGGSENGHVLNDTHVVIEGGQIGCGKNTTERHPDAIWAADYTVPDGTDLECSSWPYGEDTDGDGKKDVFATYDANALYVNDGKAYYDAGFTKPAGDARSTGSNGQTFYGSVFGGGSGFYPYRAADGTSCWVEHAGEVEGNTLVEIKGGHILTNVYGGNELTNVGTGLSGSGGKCTVRMTGGTVGVPRTVSQMVNHPLTCYVFGAGKGDQRKMFSMSTLVNETEVEISGGKIYGSVFGGGEDGRVLGNTKVTVKNTTDTTDPNNPVVTASPVIGTTGTSYVDGNIFGGGRGFAGDVQTAGDVGGNVDVFIDGGTILGSVFGGGRLASVGTWIVSPDEDRYGLFKDDTGGNTYGHVTVNISGGTIGNDLEDKIFVSNTKPADYATDALLEEALEAELSALKSSNGLPNTVFKYDRENRVFRVSHTTGGNVFGGSMGRLKMLDGYTTNDIWPELAQVKTASVNITGGTVKHNVYGGGEFGTVHDDAHVTIGGRWDASTNTVVKEGTGTATVCRDVYGGGYGSEDYTTTTTIHVKEDHGSGYVDASYTFTPMQFAGCVGITTNVNILDGWVKKNVYGGGEMASVGVINFEKARTSGRHDATEGEKENEKHTDFGLSWPYELEYQPGYEGTSHVTVTGGRIGLTGKDYMGSDESLTDDQKKAFAEDNGDVFGGGRGITGDRYDMAFCANVNNTFVEISYTDNTATPSNYKTMTSGVYPGCVSGSVYGGGENGHVIGNTSLTFSGGLIGHSMYGGGKGKDMYRGRLGKVESYASGADPVEYETDVHGFTSGKVYGNTSVTMTGGRVMRNIYGGGNMASMGKGNYAGGPDDYFTLGYGEYVPSLWTSASTGDLAWHFLNSGKTDVKVLGGTVGYINESNPSETVKDGLPYGNVFGGARGEAVPNVNVLPPYKYTPESYSGYVNESKVTIGTAGQDNADAGQSGKAPLILGSVYGGGQDGHIRRDAHVIVNSGEIGIPYTPGNAILGDLTVTDSGTGETTDNIQWLHRGNVYGSGSGISQYQYDLNNDGDYNDTITVTSIGQTVKEQDYCTSAGSVTRFTQVDINGGIIHRNVYGGGSRASVGPPPNPLALGTYPYRKDDPDHASEVGKQSQCTVNVKSMVGSPTGYNEMYGGEVYGGSRGDSDSGDRFSTVIWTKVNIMKGAHVKGNVFGGGDAGKVYKDTDVIIGAE